jgi:hypothetical protein
MTMTVTVTFEDNSTKVYPDVEDNATGDEIEAAVKIEVPNKKIKGLTFKKNGPATSNRPAPNARNDVGASSTPQDNNTGKPQAPKQDFSKHYPDRYTPPGMIRNARGNLVYY